jgi:guanylate kinase
LLIVLSAPSGGGKTTLCRQLLEARPDVTRAVTCTTRAPRKGEREGVDYYFLTPDAFQRRVQAGEFLEHATVHGDSYGTLESEVREKLKQGKDVLLAIDVQGAASVRARAQDDPGLGRWLVTIFLTPPSLDVLEQRLRRRNTDSEEVIRRRLSNARREIAHAAEFDYLLISTTIEEDFRRMQVILDAERMRSGRVQPPVP